MGEDCTYAAPSIFWSDWVVKIVLESALTTRGEGSIYYLRLFDFDVDVASHLIHLGHPRCPVLANFEPLCYPGSYLVAGVLMRFGLPTLEVDDRASRRRCAGHAVLD